MRATALAIIATIVVSTMPASAESRPSWARVAHVTDGDTFRTTTGERVRIAGIDAPETQQGLARCARELAIGRSSTAFARALLQGQDVDLRRVGTSYGRTVANVSLDGQDVAQALIAGGAARAWPRRTPKPDWCGSR